VKTYLVFEPQAGLRTPAEAERVVFLREKVSWPAFFFGPLWLVWHRLWLGLALWVAAVLLIAVAVITLRLGYVVESLAMTAPTLLVAFEATDLRRRKLLARGFREADVVLAEDIESAERRFFDRWLAPQPPKPPSPASLPPLAAPGRVIGSFPDPGAIR